MTRSDLVEVALTPMAHLREGAVGTTTPLERAALCGVVLEWAAPSAGWDEEDPLTWWETTSALRRSHPHGLPGPSWVRWCPRCLNLAGVKRS